MPDIYDRSKAMAARMLSPRSKGGKGAELTLTKTEKGPRDPDTGGSSTVVTSFLGSGLRETYEQKDIDGSLIKIGDVKLLVSPVQLAGPDMPQPATQDKVLFDGKLYTVIQVNPWNYAGLAVGFEVQGRA